MVSFSVFNSSSSNSDLAFLNSPRLLPRPRANSGSFLAPNSRKTITRMAIISGVPSPKIANVFIMECYGLFNRFFSCRIPHNTLHASSEDCCSCFCCSASLLTAKRWKRQTTRKITRESAAMLPHSSQNAAEAAPSSPSSPAWFQ